jgi:uncharacterized membrane protein
LKRLASSWFRFDKVRDEVGDKVKKGMGYFRTLAGGRRRLWWFMETDTVRKQATKSGEQKAEQHFSKYVSVPAGEGLKVDKAITINCPVAMVYGFWSRLENLPRFMRHLESVIVQDEMHSHWVAKAMDGKTLEWDAELIEKRENEMISWRSGPGADVDNAGSVWFTPVPGGQGTLVRVELKYAPPGGKAAALVARIFGRDAEKEIEENLERLKVFLETGHLPTESAVESWLERLAEASRKAVQTQ